MKVINLFGGAGTGKSTLGAELFSVLKKKGREVEIVQEYAKSLIYEERERLLSNDQLHVFATQNNRIKTLMEFSRKNPLEYVITDSPLLLSLIYNSDTFLKGNVNFRNLIVDVFKKYDNINIFIKRNLKYGYNPNGRIQKDVHEAISFDERIKNLLKEEKIPFFEIVNDKDFIENCIRVIA